MYVILVYDCGEKRVAKALKICRKYLNWIQNSVFEGELSESTFKKLKHDLQGIMDKNYDSVIIFKTNQPNRFQKEVIGVDKNEISDFL